MRREKTPTHVETKEQPKRRQVVAMMASGEIPTCNEAAQTSEEGRGDPPSTMLWSPDKISGSKRALEECAESEDGNKDDEGSIRSEMERMRRPITKSGASWRSQAKRRTTPNWTKQASSTQQNQREY